MTFKKLVLLLALFISGFAHAGPEFNLELLRFKSWGVDSSNKSSSINLEPIINKLRTKRQVIVGVVDTGIDRSHPFLRDNVLGAYDFSTNKKNGDGHDSHGHGTHVSSIIRSVDANVKIISFKYYNPSHSGVESLDATLAALDKAIEMNVDIINYSGGGPEASTEELRILKKAEKKGILIICAAGNESSNIDDKTNAFYPASYELSNIIAVSGYDQNLQTVSSSNFGKNSVDIAAPGYRIRGALPNGRSGYLTGTSQATAFVSGVASLLKSNFPHLTNKEIKEIIIKSARREKQFMAINHSSGRLDATRAFEMANQATQSVREIAYINKKSK